jgi:hypothetical protein
MAIFGQNVLQFVINSDIHFSSTNKSVIVYLKTKINLPPISDPCESAPVLSICSGS